MVLMCFLLVSRLSTTQKIKAANQVVGPFDLAKQTGVVRGGEEHEAMIQRTLQAAKAAGKKAAIFCRCWFLPLKITSAHIGVLRCRRCRCSKACSARI